MHLIGIVLLALGAFAFVWAWGMWGPGPSTPDSPKSGSRQAEQTYSVRGEVFELPDPSNPRTAFRVHHEAIDNWVGSSGKVIGMNAMTMEFEPGPGVSLKGLNPGTKIRMTFDVWWEGTPPLRYPRHIVTAIEVLPPETALEFRAAKPPASAP